MDTEALRKAQAKRIADNLRSEHPDFDWQGLARTLLPLYDARIERLRLERESRDCGP